MIDNTMVRRQNNKRTNNDVKKTLHSKLKIEQHDPHKKRTWVNSCDPEW